MAAIDEDDQIIIRQNKRYKLHLQTRRENDTSAFNINITISVQYYKHTRIKRRNGNMQLETQTHDMIIMAKSKTSDNGISH